MSGKAYFTRGYKLSASHRLHVDALSDEENWATFGKCNNPHGHGHNYRIEVTVGGPVDSATGMVMNMADLDRVVNKLVVDRFDHQNLNFDSIFSGKDGGLALDDGNGGVRGEGEFSQRVSSTENLCIAVYELLEDALAAAGKARLERVRIEETENNFFEYSGKKD